MTLDELKLYTVRVKDGSGCLFQPILNENKYTYILTAKHLFEGVKQDEDGNNIPYVIQDGTEIKIVRQIKVGDVWQNIEIPFTLISGETYFPHKNADATILKIVYLENFNNIFIDNIKKSKEVYYLNGFPQELKLQVGQEYTTYSIKEFESTGNYSQVAQLNNSTLNKSQIEGMSGGAILSLQGKYISIIGIQSCVKHPNWAHGKISFVPIKYYNEIIEEYNLATLNKFDFNKIFDFNYCLKNHDFYINRKEDKEFHNYINKNIWVYGSSGCGKTTYINKNLITNNEKYEYLDLSMTCFLTEDDIYDELINHFEIREDITIERNYVNKIKSLTPYFSKYEKVILVFDEISINENFQIILNFLNKLVVYYSKSISQKFIISTIQNPLHHSFDARCLEHISFVNLDTWEDNFADMMLTYSSHLNLDDEEKKLILENSQNNPRKLKNILYKLTTNNLPLDIILKDE